MGYDWYALPGRMFARAFAEIRVRYDVLCPVPFQTAVDRMLPADKEGPSWAQVTRDELHRCPKVRCPAQSVDRKHEIKVAARNSAIDFHRGFYEPNPRREWTECLLRERDLNGRKIQAPKFPRTTLGKVPK